MKNLVSSDNEVALEALSRLIQIIGLEFERQISVSEFDQVNSINLIEFVL